MINFPGSLEEEAYILYKHKKTIVIDGMNARNNLMTLRIVAWTMKIINTGANHWTRFYF